MIQTHSWNRETWGVYDLLGTSFLSNKCRASRSRVTSCYHVLGPSSGQVPRDLQLTTPTVLRHFSKGLGWRTCCRPWSAGNRPHLERMGWNPYFIRWCYRYGCLVVTVKTSECEGWAVWCIPPFVSIFPKGSQSLKVRFSSHPTKHIPPNDEFGRCTFTASQHVSRDSPPSRPAPFEVSRDQPGHHTRYQWVGISPSWPWSSGIPR